MAQTTVQAKPQLICPLEMGTTVAILAATKNWKSSHNTTGKVGVKFPCLTRLGASGKKITVDKWTANNKRIMRIFLMFIFICLTLDFTASGQTNKKTILGIFAHPDDENMIGTVLAKYSRLGHDVYIIIATDGKDGTKVTKIPAGDSLGLIRQQESICACEKLKINPPIYLHIDRLDTKFGLRLYLDGRKKAMGELKKYIEKLNPDVLITFGPDGEYGHSEHIITGAMVTELLLREGWVEKYPLYFPVDIKEDVIDDDEISYIDKKYINLKVIYSDEDEQKMIDAAKCYVSQTTPKEIEDLIDLVTKDKSNTKYFRQFSISEKTRTEFWD